MTYHSSFAKALNVQVYEDRSINCCVRKDILEDAVENLDTADEEGINWETVSPKLFRDIIKEKDELIKELRDKIKLIDIYTSNKNPWYWPQQEKRRKKQVSFLENFNNNTDVEKLGESKNIPFQQRNNKYRLGSCKCKQIFCGKNY